ncbi:TRAF3-interacting protein 1-like isoform X1 [Haliotis rufescens]|uniref:TRAF3-interacting protein 1-like isoform X1 n=2 Tax=Haliotis rufescens TaxID=6454 RepID=UPI00201EECAB|nr:TRAF3-interacting protein 1-like isoform X1 [Haliotis rufescens]
MNESKGRGKNRETSRNPDRGNARNAPPSKAEKGNMNNEERDSNRMGERYKSGRRGSNSPPHGSSKEPTKQGRQSEKYDNDEDDDSPERDSSPTSKERQADRAKDKSKRSRGRWKDAGDDQLRKDRRRARQDRMVKVMELFEDSLIVDKVALKDRPRHIESVIERLEELKRAYAEKVKQEVTAYWAKITEEGRASRKSGASREASANERPANERPANERPASVVKLDQPDNQREQRDNRTVDPPRTRPRGANSGQMFRRDKSRIMSGEMTQRGKRVASPEDSREKDDARDSPKPNSHPRAVNSGEHHNRGKNRVNSGDTAYRS